MSLCLMSHQQLRSYGDGVMGYSVSSDRREELRIEGELFIHYTTAAPMSRMNFKLSSVEHKKCFIT